MDRAKIVHEKFLARVGSQDLPEPSPNVSLDAAGLSPEDLIELYRAQLYSRHLDRIALDLAAKGQGFYTIGSSGHEANAAIAWALRPNDMAFLHYRDAAFQLARARQVPGQTPLWDMLLSFTVSAEDPISGGRHKVLGSKSLYIPPQTSTIASHLPKAIGAAFSVNLANIINPPHQELTHDGIIACSFGDASLNHSTAQGAINTASWTSYQNTPLPLLFICEDNGIGISVRTPRDWVHASMSARPGIKYFSCDGSDAVDTYATAKAAADYIRTRRKPAFLHMSCTRLYGHAGPDAPAIYMSKQEIEQGDTRDPLLKTAGWLIHEDAMTATDVIDLYHETEAQLRSAANQAVTRPHLETPDQIMESLIPPKRNTRAAIFLSSEEKQNIFGDADMRSLSEPQHMSKLINFGLTDLMASYPEIIMAGEDIGRKGGVYGVTQKLQSRFGLHRVIDTLLDEQSILGLAIGLGHNGFIPIPEIQFLAYFHNAEDQIRGEAATLSFFSDGQYTNPMVIRIAGLGYQRGIGGHFHNDNSLAVLRDIPGVVIACPSNGRDAVLMMREAVRLAREEQRIVAFIEPIALYMTRDLHEKGDGEWMGAYPTIKENKTISLQDVGIHGTGKDIAIVTYGNGHYFSQQAAKILKEQHDINVTIIDIRWIAPLPEQEILKAAIKCRSVLIVDECRKTGGQAEALQALFAQHSKQPIATLAAEDSFIATGPAYAATMPSRDSIVTAVIALKERG